MPWVRFSETFVWKPKPPVTIVFKPGTVINVTRACAERAKARGAATACVKPGREKANGGQG
jgi:hypothetical protein